MTTLQQKYPHVISSIHEFYSCNEYFFKMIFRCHVGIFVTLFLAAIFGNKIGIRSTYIALLDQLFRFAEENTILEVEDDDSDSDDNDGLVISPQSPRVRRRSTDGRFAFGDLLPYFSAGMKAIVDDTVHKSMTPEELSKWNMLSRNKRRITKPTRIVTILWIGGIIFRYVFLLPIRMTIFILSLTNLILCTFLVGLLPDGSFKKKCNAVAMRWCFDFIANTLSVFARFHNQGNKPTHGIAVANHTSPIDSMILATDRCYDMVGQKSTGVLGMFMKALSNSSTHIWFERTHSNDRKHALKILEDHARDESLPPVLIYPEGACVNNTAVLSFKKGVFQLDGLIYPIAIKFDPKYGDAFWWQDGFFSYILSMMSSWAIVCDIWYLPPMRRGVTESPIEFSKRVKSAIAKCGGMDELDWDGFLKYVGTKVEKTEKEISWKQKQQNEFAKTFPINGTVS